MRVARYRLDLVWMKQLHNMMGSGLGIIMRIKSENNHNHVILIINMIIFRKNIRLSWYGSKEIALLPYKLAKIPPA